MVGHEIKNKRFMAYTASAMYAAGAIDGVLEGFLPDDPPFALLPVIAAAVVFLFLVTVGPRLPWICLALPGPIGVGVISYAVATTPGAGDGAVLYTMPVLLPDTDLAGAGEFTERVRAALGRHETQGLPPLAVSAGVVCGRRAEDLQTMLQRADSALYAAKRAGRDRTMSWTPAPGPGASPSNDRIAA